MLTPSKDLGVFLAHAMYGELEKIAKFRVAGGTTLSSLTGIHELLDEVTGIRPSSVPFGKWFNRVFGRNKPSEIRRRQIAKAERALKDFEFQLRPDAQSSDPKIRSDANAAAAEAQKLRDRIRLMKQGRFSDAPAPKRRIEPDPTAAQTKPKKDDSLSGFDRTSMRVGKATLGAGALGLLGAGAYRYSQGAQSQMPY